MTKKLVASVIASLFAAAPASRKSEEAIPCASRARAPVAHEQQHDAFDRAQLDLYQDLSNGVLSNIGMQGRNSTSWFQGYGENFGRTDQYMFLRGGMYDVFKAGAYLNDIPHTFSSNAYSPYNGIGGNVLTATFPLGALPVPQPPATGATSRWGTTGAMGGFAEWQKNSPWYFRVDGNQVSFSGTKMGGGGQRLEPRQRLRGPRVPDAVHHQQLGCRRRLPERQGDVRRAVGLQPVRQRQQHASVDESNFGGNQLDTTYLAAQQHVQQVHAFGQLPRPAVAVGDLRALLRGRRRRATWASASTAPRFGWGLQPDDANTEHVQRRAHQPVPALSRGRPTPGAQRRNPRRSTTGPSSRTTRRTSCSATRRPSRRSAASVCGNFTPPGGVPTQISGNCENELYNYTKNNLGFDVWWKFAAGNRFGGGWDYNDLDQERVDYNKAHWNRLWLEYKNTMLDTVSGRLKYQYIKRDADHNFTTNGLSPERSQPTCSRTRRRSTCRATPPTC
jgi:hypothetical protein